MQTLTLQPGQLVPGSDYALSFREAIELPTGILGQTRSLARNALLSALGTYPPKGTGTFLRGLYCHYVFDDQRTRFERIIVKLKNLGRFIDTDTCLDMLRGKIPIDGRYFHLSFDDGFRNIYRNAFPILAKHKIPALHFVPSALIGASFSDTARYCLETTRYRAVIEMCTWDDLREMATAGIEIGSHSRTHARMAAISDDEPKLTDEIFGSKREIEANLGQECRFFAWPYGRRGDVDSRVLDMVTRAGYLACFGAYRGSMAIEKTQMMSIPRHLFEAQWPLSHINFFASGRADIFRRG